MNLLLNRHGRPFWAASLFVATLALSACGSDGSPTAAGESADDRDLSVADGSLFGDEPSTIAPGEYHPDAPLTTVDGLVDHLRALGAEVSYDGSTMEPSFHLPAAHQLTIDGQPASASLYGNVETLKADATLISPDGTTLDNTSVAWMSTPRFYARGNIILLYVGLEETVVQYLDTLFGQPFAGAGTAPLVDPLDPGAVGEPAMIVAGNDEELAKLQTYLDRDLGAEIAGTDMSQNWVVAVYRGAQSTAGYGIEIELVEVDAEGIVVVTVSLSDPGADELVAQVITYPVDVQLVSRQSAVDPDRTAWEARTDEGRTLARFVGTSSGGGDLPPPVDGSVGGSTDRVDPIVSDPLPLDGSVVVGADDGDMIVSDPLPVDADPLPVDPGDSVARLRPHITGIIDTAEFLEEADASGLLGRFLVRGDGSTNYDQAWVEILRDTQISFDGESFAPPTLADLAPGRTVAVIFSGPVRESYPVQAVAGQIVIRR